MKFIFGDDRTGKFGSELRPQSRTAHMRAAFVRGAGALVITSVPTPDPGPDEVLVRVDAAGICGSDLHFHRTGRHNEVLRFAGGHEISGTIVAVGSRQQDMRLGSRVAVEPVVGCGSCEWCAAGDQHLCSQLRHLAVGFAEFAVVPACKVFPLSDAVPIEAGVLADGVAVCLHAVRRAPVSLRDTALVIGDGTIGLLLVQLLAQAGCRRLGIVGSHDHTLQLAARWAHFTVNRHGSDVVVTVQRELGGRGADTVYECAGGTGDSLAQASSLVRAGGTVAILGSFPSPLQVDLKTMLLKEVTLRFCYSYGNWSGASEFALAIDLLSSERVAAGCLVTHRFPLSDIGQAFATALDKPFSGAIKVVITGSGV